MSLADAERVEAECQRRIAVAEARAKAAEAAANDRTRAARLIAANDAKARELEASRARVKLLTDGLAADVAALEGVSVPRLAAISPPAWTLPPARMDLLVDVVDARAKAFHAPNYGAPCPRCAAEKLRRRNHVPDQLWCVGCGVAFEVSR